MQLVALLSGVVLGSVVEVVGSNLTRCKIFTASIGSVDSLYHSVYINAKLSLIHLQVKNVDWDVKNQTNLWAQLILYIPPYNIYIVEDLPGQGLLQSI